MFVVNQNGNISSSSNYPSYKATYPILDSYVYKDFFKNIPGLEYLGATDATKSQYEEFPYRASLNIENSYITSDTSMPGKPNTPIIISWSSSNLEYTNKIITLDLTGHTLVLNSVSKNDSSGSTYNTNLVFTNGTVKITGNIFHGRLKDSTLILPTTGGINLISSADNIDSELVLGKTNQKRYIFINSKIVNFTGGTISLNLLLISYKTEFRAPVKPVGTPVTTKKYTLQGFFSSYLPKIIKGGDLRSIITVNKITIVDESSEPFIAFNGWDGFLILEDLSIVGATAKNYITIEL